MNIANLLRRNAIWLSGFLVLLIPSIWDISHTLWNKSDQEHGPVILALVLWLVWGALPKLSALADNKSNWGWLLVIPSLIIYVLGRSQEIWLLELGSLISLLAGVTLLNKGGAGLRIMLFPLFFMLFVIPIPGFLIDALTNGLKQHISAIAEIVLYQLGYPIARNGVTLTVGPYQLMVADACSGINSLFSLFALGLIYLYLQAYTSKLRNFLLFLVIAPIAILANIVRVLVLVLVTYYFGDEAGQGFMHGLAGILLFIVALVTLYLFDVILGLLFTRRVKS